MLQESIGQMLPIRSTLVVFECRRGYRSPCLSQSILAFSPKSHAWTKLGDMPSEMWTAAAAQINDVEASFVGDDGIVMTFNSITRRWATCPITQVKRRGAACTSLCRDMIVALGAANPVAKVGAERRTDGIESSAGFPGYLDKACSPEKFDFLAAIWSYMTFQRDEKVSEFGSRIELSQIEFASMGAMTINSKECLVFAGGCLPGESDAIINAFAMELSPSGLYLRDLPNMSVARSQAASCMWRARFTIAGGCGSHCALLKTVEAFDGHRWLDLPSMNVPRVGGALSVVNGSLFAVGGNPDSLLIERLNVEARRWDIVPAMRLFRPLGGCLAFGLPCKDQGYYEDKATADKAPKGLLGMAPLLVVESHERNCKVCSKNGRPFVEGTYTLQSHIHNAHPVWKQDFDTGRELWSRLRQREFDSGEGGRVRFLRTFQIYFDQACNNWIIGEDVGDIANAAYKAKHDADSPELIPDCKWKFTRLPFLVDSDRELKGHVHGLLSVRRLQSAEQGAQWHADDVQRAWRSVMSVSGLDDDEDEEEDEVCEDEEDYAVGESEAAAEEEEEEEKETSSYGNNNGYDDDNDSSVPDLLDDAFNDDPICYGMPDHIHHAEEAGNHATEIVQSRLDEQFASRVEEIIRTDAGDFPQCPNGGEGHSEEEEKVHLLRFGGGDGHLLRNAILKGGEFQACRNDFTQAGFSCLHDPSEAIILVMPEQYAEVQEALLQFELHPFHIIIAESLEYLLDEILASLPRRRRPREKTRSRQILLAYSSGEHGGFEDSDDTFAEDVSSEYENRFCDLIVSRSFICSIPKYREGATVAQSTTEAVRSSVSASQSSEVLPKASSYYKHHRGMNPRRVV